MSNIININAASASVDGSIEELPVSIKTLRLGKKNLTPGLFRQMPLNYIWDYEGSGSFSLNPTLTLIGRVYYEMAWNSVYCSAWVIASKDGEPYRSPMHYNPSKPQSAAVIEEEIQKYRGLKGNLQDHLKQLESLHAGMVRIEALPRLYIGV